MYTTKQAAECLGYASDGVIRLMILQNRLKAQKFGRVWMIKKSELNKFLNKGNRYNRGQI